MNKEHGKHIMRMVGLTAVIPLAGVAMQQAGSVGVASVKGIMGATQSLIGVGILSHASKLFKWK